MTYNPYLNNKTKLFTFRFLIFGRNNKLSDTKSLKLIGYTFFLGIMSFMLPAAINGQVFRPNTDGGIFGGVSYYLGDINPRKQFYDPSLSFGALIKHNFTEHHCLRVNLFYGKLKGDDLDFKNDYQQMRGKNFETSLIEGHIGYEFNFLPYIINRWKTAHTPYIFGGIGYSFVLSSTVDDTDNHITIPFGIGYKYRFNEKIGIGCEWGMRKTFTDKLDGVLNPGPDGSYSSTHNNDWYSFAGIFVTFRIFEKRLSCPAYREEIIYK